MLALWSSFHLVGFLFGENYEDITSITLFFIITQLDELLLKSLFERQIETWRKIFQMPSRARAAWRLGFHPGFYKDDGDESAHVITTWCLGCMSTGRELELERLKPGIPIWNASVPSNDLITLMKNDSNLMF